MKKSKRVKKVFSLLRLTIFLLVISGIIFWGATRAKGLIVERFFTTQQGIIRVISIDDKNDLPIKGAEFNIINTESGEVIEVLVTGVDGTATSSLLDYGIYELNQIRVPFPYVLGSAPDSIVSVELNEENYEVTTSNSLLDHIKDIERSENGDIAIKEVFITVPVVMQNPELPNGCEITSLTSVLNYYGYNVSKTVMSDSYLRKQEFERRDGKLFGANPYIAFSGNPRSARSGFYVYAPPIVEAADNYLRDAGGNHKTKDISGSIEEKIFEYVNNGIPVVIWTSIDQKPIRFDFSWNLFESGEKFDAALNLHAVVLNGYSGDMVHVMDPLKGYTSYKSNIFFDVHYSLDGQAMIVY